MRYFLAVKGIIRRNDGKILVLKRSDKDDHKPGVWETVGGGMDKEESPQQALLREIFEETGLAVNVSNPFNVFTWQFPESNATDTISVCIHHTSASPRLSAKKSALGGNRENP